VAQLLPDVAAELGQDGGVVPAAVADEQLERAAVEPGLGGDRLGRLPVQPGELAAEHDQGMVALLAAVEVGQVAGGERLQPAAAAADGVGG
jgi:hypothetical protein